MNKLQLIAYLTIGNLLAALLWNFPVNAWNWDDVAEELTNNINAIAAGESQAQAPLDVPQMQAPIGNAGNSASIQPCAAPPPTQVASYSTPEAVPSSIGSSVQPAAGNGGQRFNDRKAKVLMNLAPGNRITSVYSRLNSPDSTNMQPPGGGLIDYYATTDGLIEVKSSSGLITSIQFVQ